MSLLTRKQHIKRHQVLHKELDELIADYVQSTEKLLSETSLVDFLNWSYTQTTNPTNPK